MGWGRGRKEGEKLDGGVLRKIKEDVSGSWSTRADSKRNLVQATNLGYEKNLLTNAMIFTSLENLSNLRDCSPEITQIIRINITFWQDLYVYYLL